MASTSATSPAAPDLVGCLTAPTPAEVRQLREAAGLSHAGIASLVGIADRQTWRRYEDGRAIPLQTWALALLATGRHPNYRLAAPASSLQAPRSAAG